MKVILNNQWLTLDQLDEIIHSGAEVVLGDDARNAIEKCRRYLDGKVGAQSELIYGINTGFGSLCDTAIAPNDLEKLQRNLVLSHACGVGEEVPQEIVKRML